jgi:translation initiation factor 4E
MIGEAFDSYDEICGAVVNIRPKGDRIAVWTGNYSNKDAILEIGQKLKAGLNLPDRIELHYQTHSDSMVKNSSNVKSLYKI